MEVGFCLAYQPGETGRVAVGLADHAAALGHGVRFFSLGPPITLDPRWDRRVSWDFHNTLGHWVRGCGLDVVVFVGPAPPAYLAEARAHGARAVVMAAWDRPWGGDPGAVRDADLVVVTTPRAHRLAAEGWGLRNVRCVPWASAHPPLDPGPRRPGPVRIVLPAVEDQPVRAGGDVVGAARRILLRAPAATLTLVHTAGQLTARSHRVTRRMAGRFGPRFEVAAVDPLRHPHHDTLLRYARADLVAWPSGHEGFATTGLDALAMGTPVVALDVAPQNEFVTHLANGVLVPAPAAATPAGAPWATGGLDAFEAAVADLAEDPVRLADLRAGAAVGLARRRKEFETGWAAVLSGE